VAADERNDPPEATFACGEHPPRARRPARPEHPLGPYFYRQPSPNPRAARSWALLVVLLGGAVLAVARFLPPDQRGYGTHGSLGLPECGLIRAVGYPCPTCGMTTAFAHTVRGRWLIALHTQPAGWLLCVGVMAATGLASSVLITGRSWRLNWYRISPTAVVLVGVGLLLAAWGYKIVAGLLQGTLPAGG